MADYYIKCKVENSDRAITEVGYSHVLGIAPSNRKSKSDVISDIQNRGKDVMTAWKQGGEWQEGDGVHVVDDIYIRTDGNDIEADNLENINDC